MAVQLNGKATEKQRKYLGVLSSQGKEKFGKDFSIRKIAEEQNINWDEMTQEEASKLIEEVKSMLEDSYIKEDFTIDINEEMQKEYQNKPEAIKPPANPQVYMIQLIITEDKLNAINVVLEAMNIGYVVLKEVRP